MMPYVNTDVTGFIIAHQFIIADMANLVPPWALFLMNPILRKAIFDSLSCKPTKNNRMSPIFPVDTHSTLQVF